MFGPDTITPCPLAIDREDLYNLDAEASTGFPAHLPFRKGRRIGARPSQTETFDGDTLEWAPGLAVVAYNTSYQTTWCVVEAVERDEKGRAHLMLRMLAIHDEW